MRIIILILVGLVIVGYNHQAWLERVNDLRNVSPPWEGVSLSECVIGPPNHCEVK